MLQEHGTVIVVHRGFCQHPFDFSMLMSVDEIMVRCTLYTMDSVSTPYREPSNERPLTTKKGPHFGSTQYAEYTCHPILSRVSTTLLPFASYCNSCGVTEVGAAALDVNKARTDTGASPLYTAARNGKVEVLRVRCTFFDRNPHARMPLVPTPLLRLKLDHACDQWHV
jgi:hypothetical protein